MKITYTGKQEALTPAQRARMEAKFAKLAKLLDMKQGEREAHVILTSERHIQQAEITVRFHDHNLVGIGAGTEMFPAICDAADKLEEADSEAAGEVAGHQAQPQVCGPGRRGYPGASGRHGGRD